MTKQGNRRLTPCVAFGFHGQEITIWQWVRTPFFVMVAAWLLIGTVPLSVTPAAAADPSQPVKTIFEPAKVPDLEKIPAAGISRNFRLIAHTNLGRAGADVNGNGLGFAGKCIYIGNRSDSGGVLILDAKTLEKIGELDKVTGSNSQEHRTVNDGLNLLVVMGFSRKGTEGVNILQLWDTSNCQNPLLKSTFDYGAGKPHEFFLWRDPNNLKRVLVYQTISGENSPGAEQPNLRVIDVSNKVAPKLVATFDLRDFGVPRKEEPSEENAFKSQDNRLHSLSVSDDGKRVYLAQYDAGFLILDSTPLANSATAASCALSHLKKKNPCLKMVNPDPTARLDFKPPGPGKTHSAVKVPGKDLVILTHEFFRSKECPWGWVRIVDVRIELQPKQISTFLLHENLEENCSTVGPIAIATRSDFTSHNPIPLRNLLLLSWRGAGLRAIDISNPFTPHEAGFYFPKTSVRTDKFAGSLAPIKMVSFPVIKDGLIYVVDRFNGLFILKYEGPFREEVDAIVGPCQGSASPVLDIGDLNGTCSP